jgi:Uma2 family endonuclease
VRIDLAYLSNRKLAFITDHEKYVPFAPDLAVEIVSQRDMATELQEKIDLYLNTGTPLVWIFYPDLEQVMVHRADRTSTTILRDGFLDGEDVLPGLKIAVADLFPPSSQPSSQSASEPPADS